MVVVCRFTILLVTLCVSPAIAGFFSHEVAKSVGSATEVKRVAELIDVENDLLADKKKDAAKLKNIDSEITDLVHKRDAFKHDEARKNSEIAFLQGQLGKSGVKASVASQSEVDAALQSASKIVQQAEGTLQGKATVKRNHLKVAAKVVAKARAKAVAKVSASTGAAAVAARAAAAKKSRAAAAAHAAAELKKRATAAAAAVARAEAAKRSRAAAAAKAAARAAATQKVAAKVESRAAFEARIRAEAEAKAKFKIQAEQEAETRLRAEAEAKVRAKLAVEAAAKAKVAAAAKAKVDAAQAAAQAKAAAAYKQRNELASHADDAFKEFMAEEDGEDQQGDADYEESANALAGAIGWNRNEIETKANKAVKALADGIGGKKVVASLQGMMAGVR